MMRWELLKCLPSQLGFALSVLGVCAGCALTRSTESPELTTKTEKKVVLPSRLGTVWFPLSITFLQHDRATQESELAIRNVGLVLKGQDENKEHVVPLEAQLPQATRNVLLTGPGSLRTFYSPQLFSLSKGTYAVGGIRFELSTRSNSQIRVFNVPFVSNSENEWPETAVFEVNDGRVSAFPRVSLATTLSEKEGSVFLETKLELKDKDFIPTNRVLQAAGLEDNAAHLVLAALSTVPRQRMVLVSDSEVSHTVGELASNVGFLFEVPCDFQGFYTLIWRRTGDAREYLVTKAFSPSDSSCASVRQIPVAIRFPEGAWSLLATRFSRSHVQPGYELPPQFSSDKIAQQYFGVADVFFDVGSSPETDIKRKIAFRLGDSGVSLLNASQKRPLLYAGRLSLTTSGDAGNSMTVATVWDRKFSLQELQKLFAVTDVYNVYSKIRLVRDQVKDQVQSVMRATSADKLKAERSLTEFRRFSAKVFADCIVEREQIDPLISVSGKMSFAGLPKANYVDFFDIRVESDERSKAWIEECIDKRFHSFRLSESSQTSFSGEIQFVLE
jgi:hypothetical protein